MNIHQHSHINKTLKTCLPHSDTSAFALLCKYLLIEAPNEVDLAPRLGTQYALTPRPYKPDSLARYISDSSRRI